MMRRFATFIAFVTLAIGLLLAGGAPAVASYSCNISFVESAIWRMEVREDESTYRGPSIRDRLTYNWTSGANGNYRWTSTAMPVDAGSSTKLMTVAAAVIGEGVPTLMKGDIVDVRVVQKIDYSKGWAPVIVRRVRSARDAGASKVCSGRREAGWPERRPKESTR